MMHPVLFVLCIHTRRHNKDREFLLLLPFHASNGRENGSRAKPSGGVWAKGPLVEGAEQFGTVPVAINVHASKKGWECTKQLMLGDDVLNKLTKMEPRCYIMLCPGAKRENIVACYIYPIDRQDCAVQCSAVTSFERF